MEGTAAWRATLIGSGRRSAQTHDTVVRCTGCEWSYDQPCKRIVPTAETAGQESPLPGVSHCRQARSVFLYRDAWAASAGNGDCANFNLTVSRETRLARSFSAVAGSAPERTIFCKVAAQSVVD